MFGELDLLKERYPKLKTGRVLTYGALEKLMRVTRNPDFFAGLPMQSAQAVVKSTVTDFGNWLAAVKAYRKDPSGFLGQPRMPGYCRGNKKTYTITNQDAVLYPVYEQKEDAKLKEVKVRPYYGKYLTIMALAKKIAAQV